MRIAVTNDIYKPGGAVGLLADRFSRALLEAGHDVTLICGVTKDVGPPPSDIPHSTWDYPPRVDGLIGQLAFFKEMRLRAAVAFRRWMEVGKPDAWVCVVPPSGYAAWQVGGKDIPYLYMANSPWAREWLTEYRQTHGKEAGWLRRQMGAAPRRRLERKLVRNAAAWMVLSPTQLLWMTDEHGTCPEVEKMMIEAGVDCAEVLCPTAKERADLRDGVADEYGFDAEAPLLITSRRLVPRTGVKQLIEALAEMAKPANLLVTGGGPERATLEARVAELGLGARVKFTGIVPFERLMQLTASADFSVLPTQELEGFGLSAAEAFACGTPVVATPVGALPDVVGELSQELMTQGVSASQVAETLDRLVETQDWRGEAARKRARRYAEERFDWQKHKGRFVKLVESIASNKKSR